MAGISNEWTKTTNGFKRSDETLSLGVYVTTADVHYHGDSLHVRTDVPDERANAYQVYATKRPDDPDAASRDELVNYADVSDAVAFAVLVTRYVDYRGEADAVNEVRSRRLGYEYEWWPGDLVDGDEKGPVEALRAMLGPYADDFDAALASAD